MAVRKIFFATILGAVLGALLGWLGNVLNINVSGQFGLLVGLMLGGLVSLLVIEYRQGKALKQALPKIVVIYGATVFTVSAAISQWIVAGTLVGGFLGIFLGTLWVLLPEWFD